MTDTTSSPRRFWLAGKRAAEQDRFFRETLEPLGWLQGDEHDWDAGWVTGMPDPAQFRRVSSRRKLNHFPGNAALTVKSRLHDSLAALRQRISEGHGTDSDATARLDFFPRAYLMPRDYHALQQAALARPEQRWILKPTNASKGKGVRVLRDVAEAPLSPNWMVQTYLANPHTIRGHKYVLRLYVLISSLEPLRVYLYRQGFAKLASEPWDPEDTDNPFSQLTNPDINARNERVEVPVEFIDLDRYRTWLRDQGHDDAALFAQIEDLVSLTAISAVDSMRQRTAEAGADPRGCYELLGVDCLVDDTLKPWILECNLSPSLGICAGPESGGRIEEVVKGGLVRDMISLVDIVGEYDARSVPEGASDAARLLAETQWQRERAGGFQPLLPSAEPERYLPFFTLPTLADLQLAEALAGRSLPRPKLQRRRVVELMEDEQLALYATDSGTYYRPNDSAALIWLLATEGLDPDAIAEALSQATEGNETHGSEALQAEVWKALRQWCCAGLLCQAGNLATTAKTVERLSSNVTLMEPVSMRLDVDDRHWILEVGSLLAMTRLSAALGEKLVPLEGNAPTRLPRLAVLQEPQRGYALAAGHDVVASGLSLSTLVPALTTFLLRQAATTECPVVDATFLMTDGGKGVLCLLPDGEAEEKWLKAFGTVGCGPIGRGVRLIPTSPGLVEPLAMPWPGRPADKTTGFLTCVKLHGVLVITGQPEAFASLPVLDALAALLPRILSSDGKPLDGTRVQELVAWLDAIPCYATAEGIEEIRPEHVNDWLSSLPSVGQHALSYAGPEEAKG